MTKRFIVSEKHGKDSETTYRHWQALAVLGVLLAAYYLQFVILRLRRADDDDDDDDELPRVVAFLFAVACLAVVLLAIYVPSVSSLGNNDESRGGGKTSLEVTIYPIGVQLTTTRKTGNKTCAVVGKPTFLPRDRVVDCIVTEVILAHKVISAVVFRVRRPADHDRRDEKKNDQRPDDDPMIRLVEAFPGVEMTYEECLTMRFEIMKSLKDEPISTRTT